MTPRTLLPLALPLLLLACDQGTPDPEFRSINSFAAPSTTTVRLGNDLDPVRVISYSVGGDVADTLNAEGFDGLLAGAQQADLNAQLVLRLDGIAPLDPADTHEAFVQLQRDDELLDYPYRRFNFKVDVANSGQPFTEIVFYASSDGDDDDYTLWHDSGGVVAPQPADPVEAIEYELVGANGTITTCRADVPLDDLSLGFRSIEGTTGYVEFDIADACVDVLEQAADSGPAEAFFVRCDRSTTTATAIGGMHKLTDITLKRGVIKATGEFVVEQLTQ